MTALNQVRIGWQGTAGMPGVSTFYSVGDPTFLVNKLQTFFEALKVRIPAGITITYPNVGNVIDSSTGLATGVWSAGTTASTICSGTGTWAAPVGCVVNWRTGFYAGGRELRGKTFIVPLTSGQFETNGTLADSGVTAIQTAANAVVGGGNPLHVWSRKAGANAPVTSATVPDRAIVLRSRRA